MKTEQEQIEKMARTMCGYCSTDGKCAVSKNGREPDICANVDDQHCLYKEYAERLIDNSYGDVTEYKAEIERLKEEIDYFDEFVRRVDDIRWYVMGEPVTTCKTLLKYIEIEKKQAKIDVLNKLRRRAWQGYQIGMYIVSTQEIDELIKEVQNAEDKG